MNYQRSFIAALLLMAAGIQTAWTQKLVLYTTDKGAIEFDFADLDSISFSEESVAEDMWVDLGLPSGTLWATCNLGASSPEDYGYYFAWGETEPKSNYTWSTYKWMTAGQASWDYINKYTFPDNQTDGCWYSGSEFVGDNKQELDAEDDAAKAILGSSWQIPTIDQIYELLHGDYIKSEWTVQNGIYGRKVTSKKNGNSIFLPAAGWYNGTSLVGGGTTGYYWSNSLGGLTVDYAFPLYFEADYWGVEHQSRFRGHSIRPVHVLTLVSHIELSKSELTLKPGESYRLAATVSPSDASNKAVTWESSDPSVAKVIYSGSVTAVSKGTCTITCTAKDGSGVYAQCQVRVKEEDTKEYVDLGLPSGTLWATCNVGASTPEESGDYFAWGETEPKDDYISDTYKWIKDGKLTKYCTESTYGNQGTVDGRLILEPEDDAATVNWGCEWQMPTSEQQTELRKYTTATWTTQNGVKGMLLTSKRNGNTLFLPAAGHMDGTTLEDKGSEGWYWGSEVGINMSFNGYKLSFESSTTQDKWEKGDFDISGRHFGYNVRPVRVKEEVHEFVDLGLPSGTLWAKCNIGARRQSEYGDYFAWGETEPKDDYSWSTYFDTKDEGNTFKKYNNNGGLTLLQPDDDAATANWGSDWQMPTIEQLEELIDEAYTTVTWTNKEGFYGRLITSKLNGKSVFLPAAGFRSGTNLIFAGSCGYCWSIPLSTDDTSDASALYFHSEKVGWSNTYRYFGQSVRPVRKQKAVKEYVDLGLPSGTLWATHNVGAASPEEQGELYAWGELKPKADYSWENYSFCNGTSNTLTMYCTSDKWGTVDDREELWMRHDVATANWGRDWQMPTGEQCAELINKAYTTAEAVTLNGVVGQLITSKINGNSIFLPACIPYEDEMFHEDGMYSFYWSRSIHSSAPFCALGLCIYSSLEPMVIPEDRCNGMAIRPVRKKTVIPEYVDLGLPSHTQWASCNVGADCPEEFGEYFAWGETKPKLNYSWKTYKYCEGDGFSLTKYCQNGDNGYEGYTDNRKELESKDDAATANLGGYWQTPSKAQFEELMNNQYTTRVVTTQKGIKGMLITSKSNGNSIFLSQAGYYDGGSLIYSNYDGYYWSRMVDTPSGISAFDLYFSSDYSIYTRSRYYGLPVRPVQMTIN